MPVQSRKNQTFISPEQAKKFARRVKKFRRVYGVSQKQLAAAMGVVFRTVQHIESGEHIPYATTVAKFAEIERNFKAEEARA